MKLFKLSILAAALVGTLVACNKNDAFLGDSLPLTATDAANAAGNQTGQSIMVNLDAVQTQATTITETYNFNKNVALSYFKIKFENQTQSAEASQNTQVPAASSTPPTLEYSADEQNGNSDLAKTAVQCHFFNGSDNEYLIKNIQRKVKVPTRAVAVFNNKGKQIGTDYYYIEYTFNYKVVIDPVPAMTAWTVNTNDNGQPNKVEVTANIAALSVLISSQFPGLGKGSFTLGDRIQNLKVEALLGGEVVKTFQNNDLVTELTGYVTKGESFDYRRNAGGNNTGIVDALEANGNYNSHGILANDNAANSNTTDTERFYLNPVTFELPDGDYTFRISAVVKDNAGSTQTPNIISVTSNQVTIGKPQCAN